VVVTGCMESDVSMGYFCIIYPMGMLHRLFRLIYSLYAFLLFILLMLLVFPFTLIASFWGKMKGGNFIYGISRLWADTWMFLIGIRHENIFLNQPEGEKQYIFVANHISFLDVPCMLKSCREYRIRALGKSEMKKVPVFGFIYRNGAVMVDRGSPDNRAKSVRILKSVLAKGISIFIFPEGTFNESNKPLKAFYDGAFRIAIETQTPIKPLLFLDTYDRMSYKSLFSINPGKSRTLFLDEIRVEGLIPDDIEMLKTKVYTYMETMLIKYQVSWIRSR
jgi:1-acyl-sn-glycerol-3-phosphate acyltransferase